MSKNLSKNPKTIKPPFWNHVAAHPPDRPPNWAKKMASVGFVVFPSVFAHSGTGILGLVGFVGLLFAGAHVDDFTSYYF